MRRTAEGRTRFARRRLREAYPDARVIAPTTCADESSVLAALQAGARGY